MGSDEKISRGRRGDKPEIESTIEQTDMKRGKSAALDEARLRQQAIGVRLRQMFDDVVKEPVPDDFLSILRRADERTSEKD